MSDLFNLSGKRALVTGSSRGIGLALARGMIGAGASVVLNGRDAGSLAKAAEGLATLGGDVQTAAFDVTDPDAVEAGVSDIEDRIGPIDILFNNAGMNHRAPLHEFPLDKWRALMNVNLDSAFYVSRAVAQRMIPRGRGKIINTCSAMTRLARENVAPYTASKGAIGNLTTAMCADWAKHGLQVNGIAPGYFKTELTDALVQDAEFTGWLEKRTPAGRWGELDELIGAAVFLASDAASYVNGHVLYVDGGLTVTV